MSGKVQQTPYGTIASALTTGLNSLTNGSRAISAAIDNSTERYPLDDLELAVTYGTNPTAGSLVSVYLIPSVDGTNYADGDASIAPPGAALVAAFELRVVTTAQRIGFRNVEIPPGLFKYVVLNGAGQTMAASGNTLKRRPHGYEWVDV